MKQFEVTFESSGFVGNRKIARKIVTDEDGLTKSFCSGFNDQTTTNGKFPDGVVGVVTGYITEDDQQGNADIKVFASVTLLIEAEDESAADSFEPPVELLTTLADVMGTVDDKCLLSLDGEWEVVNVENPKPTGNDCTCDDCGTEVPSIVGCPDGSEICQSCFSSGAH